MIALLVYLTVYINILKSLLSRISKQTLKESNIYRILHLSADNPLDYRNNKSNLFICDNCWRYISDRIKWSSAYCLDLPNTFTLWIKPDRSGRKSPITAAVAAGLH